VNVWKCRVRYPTRERNSRKQTKQTTTTTTTPTAPETIIIDGVERTVTTVTNGIPSIDTINASIDGARRKLIDNINGSLNNDK